MVFKEGEGRRTETKESVTVWAMEDRLAQDGSGEWKPGLLSEQEADTRSEAKYGGQGEHRSALAFK